MRRMRADRELDMTSDRERPTQRLAVVLPAAASDALIAAAIREDRPTRVQAQSTFGGPLEDQGYLGSGHAEPPRAVAKA